MGEHYYSPNPTSAHDARTVSYLFRGRTLRFETDAGVFSRQHVDKGTGLLLAALPERFCGRALDLGCGWGAVGVCMASCWPEAQVALTDINERAVALSRKNMAANGLRGCVYCGDGLQNVPGRFHLIATNPAHPRGQGGAVPALCAGHRASGGGRRAVSGHPQAAGRGIGAEIPPHARGHAGSGARRRVLGASRERPGRLRAEIL